MILGGVCEGASGVAMADGKGRWLMAGNPSVVVERACEEGQSNLRVWAVCGCAAEIWGECMHRCVSLCS